MAIIEVNNLSKKFRDFTAVSGLSFQVSAGEIVAFLGPNGAGKTTTIKMLTTVLKPTGGQLSLAGANPVTEKNRARQAFGIVFQDASLDEELTAYENMLVHAVLYHLPAKGRKEKIDQLLSFVELADRRRELVKNFSGGMKRRLEIAKGLLHHPQILFLDEPTQGLDPQTRHHIWDYIKKLNQTEKMTVFFTTHYIEEADKMADRVIIVDHGRIIAIGSPAELKSQAQTDDLEGAFIKLTGSVIREEKADGLDRMRRRFHH
ncbi:MAG: ATP-binding cassette domain-containing protein [Patescibacteria group bacterium]